MRVTPRNVVSSIVLTFISYVPWTTRSPTLGKCSVSLRAPHATCTNHGYIADVVDWPPAHTSPRPASLCQKRPDRQHVPTRPPVSFQPIVRHFLFVCITHRERTSAVKMFEIFGSLKSMLKIDSVSIDNVTFKIHYKVTMIALLFFSLLITSRQYFGDPIDCIADKMVDHQVMDTYCWIHATFTVRSKTTGRIGLDVAHPGVGTYVDGEDPVMYHMYYQWVWLALLFQAALFYIPRYLWKSWEGGRVRWLVNDVNCAIVDDECKNERKQMLLDYMTTNFHMHNMYALKYFFCELLNLVNVIFQMYFLDFFFDGEFSDYGLDVLAYANVEPENRVDAMNRVFPKITKCSFKQYGPSGTVQLLDNLCVLPLNVVNEKIYAYMWFWFKILAILNGVNVLYRLVILAVPRLRLMLLKSSCHMTSNNELSIVVDKCNFGDWFMLYQLSKNVNPFVYSELISALSIKLQNKEIV